MRAPGEGFQIMGQRQRFISLAVDPDHHKGVCVKRDSLGSPDLGDDFFQG